MSVFAICLFALPALGAEELKLTSRGAVLAATLRLPHGTPGPFPAVVLVHGSGRVTRQLMGRMGDRFLEAGIAVLTYDKRGVGESGGSYASIGPANSAETFDLLAADALAGVAALKSRKDIDARRIGLGGPSQAGWIMPLAATRSADVNWLVIVSAPAVSVGEEIAYSRLAGEDPGSMQGLTDQEIERRMRGWNGIHGFDPVPVLEKLRTPAMWVQGEKDRSIPQRKTLAVLDRLKQGGTPVTVLVIPNANHSLRDVNTGVINDFWPRVYAWLRERGVIPS